MEEQGQTQRQTPPPPEGGWEEDTFSILDVLLVIARHRRLIGFTTLTVLAIGLLIAILSPPKYTASAKVIRETTTETPGGLTSGLAALRGLGISIVSSSVGITAETYPAILRSREVRLVVARSSFYFDDLDASMNLVDYYNRPPSVVGSIFAGLKNVTIGLPGTLMRMFRSNNPSHVIMEGDSVAVYPTKEEEETIKWLKDMVRIDIDRNTAIMSIAVTTHDPLLSAELAKRFTRDLTERVQDIYTQKAREDQEFVRARFAEAKQELKSVEEELSGFLDRNRDPQTARLRMEMERLQRQVDFKSQLYADLQTQLTQAEIELQRSQPVITLIEAPVPPLEPSGPRRKMIVVLSLFLGAGFGIGLAVIKNFMKSQDKDAESRAKLLEIREAIVPKRLLRRQRRT